MNEEQAIVTSVLRDSLSAGLATVMPVVQKGSTLPVLSNVFLKCDGETVEIVATDLETTIQAWVGCGDSEEWALTVPVKPFAEMVSLVGDDQIDLSPDIEMSQLYLRSRMSRARFLGIAAVEFPYFRAMPRSVGNGKILRFDGDDLAGLIRRTMYSAMTITFKPVLSSLLFRIEDGVLVVAATDGYRLSEAKMEFPSVNGPFEMILPVSSMKLVAPLAKEADVVTLEYAKGDDKRETVTFRFDERVAMTVHNVNAIFPDYKPIIPKKFQTVIDLPAKELTRALRTVQVFAREGRGAIGISVDAETSKVELIGDDAAVGDGVSRLDAAVTGESQHVHVFFDGKFLQDAVRSMGDCVVRVGFNGINKPVTVKAADDSLVAVIMPMQTR